MKLQTSLALVCTLFVTASLDARTPTSRQTDESRQAVRLRTRAHQAAQQIRLVGSAPSDRTDPIHREAAQRSAVGATRRTMNNTPPPMSGPLPAPRNYVQRYNGPPPGGPIPYGTAPPDPEWRSRQPATMGHIFEDNDYEDRCREEQFCRRVWECAGGRNQCCFQRWERDFWRSYDQRGSTHLNWLRGMHGCFVQHCLAGWGHCSTCGCEGGDGCGCAGGCAGGCGEAYGEGFGPGPGPGYGLGPYDQRGSHSGPGPHSGPSRGPVPGAAPGVPTPAEHAKASKRQRPGSSQSRILDDEAYISALEDEDPTTEIVGNIQILHDRVIR